jgi:hypothetical protein
MLDKRAGKLLGSLRTTLHQQRKEALLFVAEVTRRVPGEEH